MSLGDLDARTCLVCNPGPADAGTAGCDDNRAIAATVASVGERLCSSDLIPGKLDVRLRTTWEQVTGKAVGNQSTGPGKKWRHSVRPCLAWRLHAVVVLVGLGEECRDATWVYALDSADMAMRHHGRDSVQGRPIDQRIAEELNALVASAGLGDAARDGTWATAVSVAESVVKGLAGVDHGALSPRARRLALRIAKYREQPVPPEERRGRSGNSVPRRAS
jgi:hypothetical protein